MKNTITICIPTYNEGKIVINALESIVNQTLKVNEIIVCDDCSKNDTLFEVEKYIEKKNDIMSIKCFVNKNNMGYAQNWNKCLEYSNSDYTLILHADDILKPTTIEKQINYFKEYPEMALVGGYEDFIDENGKLIESYNNKETKIYQKGAIYEFVKNHNSYIACSSVMFSMEKIRKIGFFDENYLATDELYWPKVLTKFPIAVLGEALINRRIHSGQIEYSDFKNKKSEIIGWSKRFAAIIDYEKRLDKKEKLNKIIKTKLSYSTISISRSSFVYHKSLSLGFFYLFHGIKMNPLMLFHIKFWKNILHTSLVYFGFKKH